MKPQFTYIIPVFNKQDIIGKTVAAVFQCSSANSEVIVVIDGCTDKTEAVVDGEAAKANRIIKKIHMPDVHMLLSVNAALRVAKGDYIVVMQDDIVLREPSFETKIVDVYKRLGPRLGVISLRLGANVSVDPSWRRVLCPWRKPLIYEMDYIQGESDTQNYTKAPYEKFVPRMAAINGPNIIPRTVLNAVGILDEKLAPYGYDDPEYCLRAISKGFVNGLFPLRYESREEWGGTRRSKKFKAEVAAIHLRNRRYIFQKHSKQIRQLWRTGALNRSSSEQVAIDHCINTDKGET